MPTKMSNFPHTFAAVLLLILASAGVAGCGSSPADSEPESWAINVGGPAYDAIDGAHYLAEESVEGGVLGTMEKVKGSQDALLYKTFRSGDVTVMQAMAKGHYDVTFHFAEPDEIGPRERIFDVYAEGELVIDDLDVMLLRDGKVISGLSVTIPNVEVTDGELNVRFEASAGEPMLSALLVRPATPRDDAWQLVWSDEFEGNEIDDTKWSPNIWAPRKVNDEDQAYTPREKNLRLEDGNLVIEAHLEDYEGGKYTSGRLHSDGKGDFLYGRFEVRAKLPSGQGTWPAIWMLPSDPFTYATKCSSGDWQGSTECDAWPNSGEMDIMEHVGYQMNHVHGTVHTKAYYWVMWEQRKGRILLDDVDKNFHVYAMEWSPEKVDVFVDDTLYFTYINENTGWEAWPFDKPFHLILNIAVGGAWGRAGGPIDDSVFPQQMLIDYVRVYEAPSP